MSSHQDRNAKQRRPGNHGCRSENPDRTFSQPEPPIELNYRKLGDDLTLVIFYNRNHFRLGHLFMSESSARFNASSWAAIIIKSLYDVPRLVFFIGLRLEREDEEHYVVCQAGKNKSDKPGECEEVNDALSNPTNRGIDAEDKTRKQRHYANDKGS